MSNLTAAAAAAAAVLLLLLPPPPPPTTTTGCWPIFQRSGLGWILPRSTKEEPLGIAGDIFTGRTLFLSLSQQRQGTEGTDEQFKHDLKYFSFNLHFIA